VLCVLTAPPVEAPLQMITLSSSAVLTPLVSSSFFKASLMVVALAMIKLLRQFKMSWPLLLLWCSDGM